MEVSIGYLTDYPEAIPVIAGWHITQWAHILPEYTLESYARFLTAHYRRGGIPTMFLALHKGRVIGTIALDNEDMSTHPEFSPWLASLYVDKKYRGKGVADTLVKRVISEAESSGVNRLYLYTHDRQKFYERYGWKTLLREQYNAELQSVMALDIYT